MLEFCRRVLGSGPGAVEAARAARRGGSEDRLQLLAGAHAVCRDLAREDPVQAGARSLERSLQGTAAEAQSLRPQPRGSLELADGHDASLSAAVARELEAANAALPERHREALVLRELLALTHEQIATVVEIEPDAVAELLARARLGLRTALRGAMPATVEDCAERDRALAGLARRQDAETRTAEENEWLLAHIAGCEACDRAHSAMLEASACYHGWRAGSPPAASEP